MSTSATDQAVIAEIDDAGEAFDMFDAVCRRALDLSGSEFLRRWDAGQYEHVDVDDVDGLSEVVASIPMVR